MNSSDAENQNEENKNGSLGQFRMNVPSNVLNAFDEKCKKAGRTRHEVTMSFIRKIANGSLEIAKGDKND